jgi:hypothetical protein
MVYYYDVLYIKIKFFTFASWTLYLNLVEEAITKIRNIKRNYR